MSSPASADPLVLGFLTVVREEENYIGGYLLVNELGRPLEFHCTTPVRPSRAQEILYGAALPSFLYGEYLGRTLVEKARTRAALVLLDRAELLEVRRWIPLPTLQVHRAPESETPGLSPPVGAGFELGGCTFLPAEPDAPDRDALRAHLERIGPFDWREPFERIHEAIAEAHRNARQQPAA